ncbi:hypothetical protein BV210_07230 [Halorientalis sp. IM1011]|uniref:PAS domain-containing protein n=1 Tax=Halorientalis sp. IM1011 TaxID=1932360 RepID=UPI00097CCF83|nr:PAS domain-containing protein [Halorientalis sp. IM1011]AQL42515.1 hypothetical protein BV210_07230 [Halorientalis sp. IM1011]
MSDEPAGTEAPVSGWAVDDTLVGTLARTVDAACFRLDDDRRLRAVTDEVLDLTGRSREELLGEHVSVLFESADAARAEIGLRRLGTDGEAVESVAVAVTDGEVTTPCTLRLGRGDDGVLGVLRPRADEDAGDGSHREFEEMIDAVTDYAIFTLDTDGTVVSWNTGAERIKGYTAEEIVGERFDVFYTAEDREAGVPSRNLARAVENGRVEDEGWRVRADGSRFWANVVITPVHDDGDLDGFVKVTRDMTEHRERARQLKRQHDELQTELGDVFARISDGLYGLDSELRFSYVNERAAELLGLAEHEVLGKDIHDELDPTDRFEAALQEALHEQSSVTIEDYYPPLDAWFENTIYPTETGLSVYFRDVTERKEREQALAQSRRRYRTLIEEFPNGVVTLFDEELRYLVAGGEGFENYPFDAADLENHLLEDCLPPELVDQIRPHYEAVFDGAERDFEVSFGGQTLQFHAVPVRDEDGRVVAGMGMSQDVTDQRQRQAAIETRVRQQTVVTELGQRALAAENLDALFATTVQVVAETLDSDYCKVLDLDEDGDALSLRAGVGWREGLVGEASVPADRDSQAGYTLLSEEPVAVEDLRTEDRFSGPELLTSHGVRSGISVVVGTTEDPWGVLGVHDTEPREFTQQDANFVQAVANILATAIERVEHERTLRHQREQLAALNNLNAISRGIIRALLRQSTREEVEQLVCDRLADSNSYTFAWVGTVDEQSDEVVPRAEAGVTDYLDDVTIRVDDSDDAQGPTGRAFRTNELQVSRNVQTDAAYEQWRDHAEEYGYRTSAAVPISSENTVYGVLNVYTQRPDAFDTEELAVLGGLGDVMGHAMNAIEHQRLLMSDEITEVEFRIRDLFGHLDLDDGSGTVTVAETIPTGEGQYLAYGTASEEGQEWLDALVEAVPHWEELNYVGMAGDGYRFELRLDDPPLLSLLSAHGGRVRTARIKDGDYHMTVELPPDAPVRAVVDGVQETYPEAEMLVQRRTTLDSRDVGYLGIDLDEILTERQLAAVEAAYYAGFFDWPRGSTGEEVAEALGISPPTFHQHLRAAEQHVLRALLDPDDSADGR